MIIEQEEDTAEQLIYHCFGLELGLLLLRRNNRFIIILPRRFRSARNSQLATRNRVDR